MNETFSFSRNTGSLSDQVLEFVQSKDSGATFAAIQEHCGRRGKGKAPLVLPSDPKVVLWKGLSDELACVVVDLCESRLMHWHPCTPVEYWPRPLSFDVPWLTWPIEGAITTESWLPITFHAGASCEGCAW